MPEGPEIATQRDEIRPHTVNKILTNIEVLSGRYQRHPETWEMPLQLPLRVNQIETSGKLLYWELENENHIFCRAGMSGRWNLKEEKHNHIRFSFSDGSHIYFNDMRNFGSIKFGQKEDKEEILSSLGPDPLKEEFTYDKIQHKLRPLTPIGKIMLEQEIFNSVGNYLRAEILYAARINPFRICSSLSREEWDLVCQKTNELTNLSYQDGGATIRSYKNLNGERGKFQERFMVYGRKQDSEGRNTTRAIDESGRAIWFVEEYQR